MEAILISYVPLLMGEAGRTDFDPDDLQEILEQTPSGQAAGCVWLFEDGEMAPCFVMHGARDIAEHLKLWAEGKPEDWFQLVAAESGPLYGLALMPRLDKGVERFRMAYHLRNGLPFPKDAHIKAVFKPLHFGSKPGHMFARVKPQLGKKCAVFLVDLADVDMSDPSASNLESLPIELGRFELDFDSSGKGHVAQMLEEQLRDAG